MTAVPSTHARRRSRRSRRGRRLANVLILMLALFVVGGAYALAAPSSHAAQEPANNQQQVAFGHDLFLRSCSTCHGLNGEGSKQAPSLIGVGAAAVDFQVGTGRMPLATFNAQAMRKPPRFQQPEIDALAAYVASLAPGPAIPQFTSQDVKNADVAHGGAMFRTNCAQCHNAVGEGGILSKGVTAPVLKGATDKQIYEAMLTGPEQMPVFSDKTIKPSDKLDIIAYLDQVNKGGINPGGHPIGRIGPVTEGLVIFTAGIGVCVALTLWIGTRT